MRQHSPRTRWVAASRRRVQCRAVTYSWPIGTALWSPSSPAATSNIATALSQPGTHSTFQLGLSAPAAQDRHSFANVARTKLWHHCSPEYIPGPTPLSPSWQSPVTSALPSSVSSAPPRHAPRPADPFPPAWPGPPAVHPTPCPLLPITFQPCLQVLWIPRQALTPSRLLLRTLASLLITFEKARNQSPLGDLRSPEPSPLPPGRVIKLAWRLLPCIPAGTGQGVGVLERPAGTSEGETRARQTSLPRARRGA